MGNVEKKKKKKNTNQAEMVPTATTTQRLGFTFSTVNGYSDDYKVLENADDSRFNLKTLDAAFLVLHSTNVEKMFCSLIGLVSSSVIHHFPPIMAQT